MPADPVFDPERILLALNQRRVRYVVVGGLAVAAHGVVRATADLDIVVERTWDNAGALADALRQLDAVDLDGSQEALSREALVRRADRRFRTPHGDVHVLHEVGGVPEYGELVPSDEYALGDLVVPVATLPALRAMKRAAARDKDRIDLAELDALHGPSEITDG